MFVNWYILFFFFKQKTAYDMRISDWSSDVYSSDLAVGLLADLAGDSECRIDIDHIERFFHHMVEGRAEARQDFCGVRIGDPHLVLHRRKVGRLSGMIEGSW